MSHTKGALMQASHPLRPYQGMWSLDSDPSPVSPEQRMQEVTLQASHATESGGGSADLSFFRQHCHPHRYATSPGAGSGPLSTHRPPQVA